MLNGIVQSLTSILLAESDRMVPAVLGLSAGLCATFLLWVAYRQKKRQLVLLEEKLCAEKTVVEKSAFLASISHEIRTPMGAILGFSELLAAEPLTPRQSLYVRSIQQSGASLLQLINDVLDVSKIEAGRMELLLEPTDAREICSFLRMMFAQQAAGKSLQLKFETADLPSSLMLDRLRLRQVLVNLVGNAIKFTEKGSVTVRLRWAQSSDHKDTGALLIDVEDTGVGISLEKQADIFKPFVQSYPQRAVENQGTGLGLHIVQRLTELMGGSVSVESTPGRGSIFHLRLDPVSISARQPTAEAIEKDGTADFNDLAANNLLVVAEGDTARGLFGGIFAGSHHQLQFIGHGPEAVAAIVRQKPNLVLLDMLLPTAQRRTTVSDIHQAAGLELLPVIAISACSQPDEEHGLRNQFTGFLRKPFTRRELYQELAEFLPRARVNGSPALHSGTGTPPSNAEPMASHASANNNTGATGKTKPESWKILVPELRSMQAAEWPGLRDSLAISATQVFARKLYNLGQARGCSPLTVYAGKLGADAESYSIRELRARLLEFPDLIRTIEQTCQET
jgi:signal transduction histidine kinase/CheY-like chemotaxis protein